MSSDTLQWMAIGVLALALLGQGYLKLEAIAAGWGVLLSAASLLVTYLKGGKPK